MAQPQTRSQTTLPDDYEARIYAGVLGKIIGVYLGRPFEGWTYEKIMAELGEVNYYVHEKLGTPLIVTDDDISGTFTFLRAFEDHRFSPDLTPEQIGSTWLNYIIENRTILWWGGMGISTEHTAYLRLKNGVAAPQSGSIRLNGRTAAEQIGAQIFIDGWAMINAGDPARAAEFARRAASVSHDGEAVCAAQVIAAMEAAAFVEPDLNRLLDTALSLIPRDSLIARLIQELRELHAREPDWHEAREWLHGHYGYDQYGGGCHVVPNHGVIILGLLYGEDDFQTTLKIVNTCGWDTDCNSGNAGCLMGIKNGLRGIDASAARGFDFRTPVADRLYLPTADGSSAITDAGHIADWIAWLGGELHGEFRHNPPNDGYRYNFRYPGSVQGFTTDDQRAQVDNARGSGYRWNALRVRARDLSLSQPVYAKTAVFTPPDAIHMANYELTASPSLYPGSRIFASVGADETNPAPIAIALTISVYTGSDTLRQISGEAITLLPGEHRELEWTVPETDGQPVAEVGLSVGSEHRVETTAYLHHLSWSRHHHVTFRRPADGGTMWRRAWVSAVDRVGDEPNAESTFDISHREQRGMLMGGWNQWHSHRIETTLLSHLASEAGIAFSVRGLRRYYAALLCADQTLKLVRMWDGQETLLAQQPFEGEAERPVRLTVECSWDRHTVDTMITVWLDNQQMLHVTEPDHHLSSGSVALVVSEGRLCTGAVTVKGNGS